MLSGSLLGILCSIRVGRNLRESRSSSGRAKSSIDYLLSMVLNPSVVGVVKGRWLCNVRGPYPNLC